MATKTRPSSKAPAAPSQPVESPASESPAAQPELLTRNLLKAGIRAQELAAQSLTRMAAAKAPLDPLNVSGAMASMFKAMSESRETVAAAQKAWWRDTTLLWESTALKMLGGTPGPVVEPAAGDRRFRAAEWQSNEIFDFLKQSYLITANALQEMVGQLSGLTPLERRRALFFTRQFADALAPTNFPLTNPEVLKATIASNGENLIRGLENLAADLARGGDGLAIRQSADGFVIGENIATAPGKVVFRNELIELIQYAPATETVYQRPLLIFPPWINKFYIIDLRPENSFVRWLVGRGYTVFLVSWVNPDASAAQKGFEEYMRQGVFAALDAVKDASGVSDPNCVGYCIGGTLLAATLAYMAAKKDERIHSATFWAAQTDFSEAGELQVFVDDVQIDALKKQMDKAGGVLPGAKMAGAFNMLRANDLIWSFVINNYLLGKPAAAFDLLYWNSDTTRMPEKLHLSYLRNCYRDNALAKGEMELGGVRLDLTKVKVPVYLQSAREDHIAPARSVYKAVHLFSGPARFILAGSGHIAGVINPPAANKYQYWTNDTKADDFDAWLPGAKEHPGSWWTDWDQWLSKLSGEQVPARVPGDGALKPLSDAPGEYVKVKAQ
ncbi:MAG: class I poly(R)-hydroxyalkanoic acid synthase [Alphaproteobacteria bacterium]|nr:class I poly(R)-hydroxyalkanoic acid synthase [Alphaproteobacteria bacterium]